MIQDTMIYKELYSFEGYTMKDDTMLNDEMIIRRIDIMIQIRIKSRRQMVYIDDRRWEL